MYQSQLSISAHILYLCFQAVDVVRQFAGGVLTVAATTVVHTLGGICVGQIFMIFWGQLGQALFPQVGLLHKVLEGSLELFASSGGLQTLTMFIHVHVCATLTELIYFLSDAYNASLNITFIHIYHILIRSLPLILNLSSSGSQGILYVPKTRRYLLGSEVLHKYSFLFFFTPDYCFQIAFYSHFLQPYHVHVVIYLVTISDAGKNSPPSLIVLYLLILSVRFIFLFLLCGKRPYCWNIYEKHFYIIQNYNHLYNLVNTLDIHIYCRSRHDNFSSYLMSDLQGKKFPPFNINILCIHFQE